MNLRANALLAECIQIVKILSEVDQSRSIINKKDEEGWAPLHSAASIGSTQIVEILLSKGNYIFQVMV